MTAPTSGVPTRDSALLIAEPMPALRVGIELISVVVRGGTTREIPSPNRISAGRPATKSAPGGPRLAGPPTDARHGDDVAGMRAHQRTPAAMISGPATRK